MSNDRDTQIANLNGLDHDRFQALISNNLGKEDRGQLWDLLADPALCRRTYMALTAIYNDVCGQLGERSTEWDLYRTECRQRPDGKQDWFDGLNEYKAWRRRALGYKRLVSARVVEIKEVLPPGTAKAPRQQPDPKKKVRLASTIFNLGWAIREHQRRSAELDIKPEPHDLELWDRLAEIEVETGGGVVTVAEMLDRVASDPDFRPPFA